jgi:transmembrane sensor
MQDFTHYKREDFLAEESFSNYLLQVNELDIIFWKKWIRENPQSHEEINKAKELFFLLRNQKHFAEVAKQDEIENEYSKLQSLIKKDSKAEGEIISLNEGSKNSDFKKIMLRITGVAAILIILVSLWKYSGPANKVDSKTEFILFAQTSNISKEVTLPDGSLVQLNNYSSVDISRNFNNKKREVLLKGSAFFKVYKDPSRPFIVTSGSIKTTALGTAFYVYNLHPETISVSLLRGKVRVEGNQNYVELLPGEKALYTFGERISKDSFNKEQLLSFTNGKIEFEHANLEEIKTVLREYFNKEVVVTGKAPKINFTGNFDSKRIETILEALQFTYNIQYKVEGQKVAIYF